ncbi:MAG TPA: class I SAM-dependent methyltransferase [Acidimicrobiales bacterium]
MSFYVDRILPRCTNLLLSGSEFTKIRSRVASGLTGDVMEVGFGSGLNVPHYPSDVDRVLAVDPAVLGRKLAAGRVSACPVPVEYVGLDGASLPLGSATIDHVLVTWTLCTIPEVNDALGEVHRVLRSGGKLHFVEHGLSPDLGVAKWQHRLTPLQRRVAGGCHLNRPIDRLIEGAGFAVTQLDTYQLGGPKPWSYMYEGVATKP